MTEGIGITALLMEDLPAVLEIERASHPAPWSEAMFRDELASPDRTCYVAAREPGRLLGYGGFWRIADEVNVINLAVRPDARGRGAGRAILTALLDRARAEGAKLATLEVRAGAAPARRLYESSGFRPVAMRRGFYPPDGEDAVVMMMELAP